MKPISTPTSMSTTGCSPIPPIEIGSFVAHQPDKSEFIGSASGVFFVNTVFRAFAACPSASTEPLSVVPPNVPDPTSAHDCLVAPENVQESADGIHRTADATDENSGASPYRYGISAPGLGVAPDFDLAKDLLMIYFRKWHPFLPFLHGRSFFDQVNQFYGERSGRATSNDTSPTQHTKTCQAIIFQCVFNLAAFSHRERTELLPSCRIQSTLALTSLLGAVSSTNNMSSLQALLAMELYLISQMSLRAASTVHGMLTQMLYHSGFHRCPHRYVQLSRQVCDIRKRLFWSVYVLDRYLSQALGHPISINDEEVDVCIPGMTELHRPVKPSSQTSISEPTAEEQAHSHLPGDSPISNRTEKSAIPSRHHDDTGRDASESRSARSQAHHHRINRAEAGEYVLGYLATHARLVGRALTLFHMSIHNRNITWDKVLDLTCQVQSWWNSLPPIFQEDSASDYAAFFAVLYNGLILFINRPFLSLPSNRADFRASLQAAVAASRALILKLKQLQGCFILTWHGDLSTIWMAGLVVAFASLQDLYPVEKAKLDLEQCLNTLDVMSTNWISAKHCRVALKLFLDKLKSRFDGDTSSPETPLPCVLSSDMPKNVPNTPIVRKSAEGFQAASMNEGTATKRRRLHSETISNSNQARSQDLAAFNGAATSHPYIWQPVLEYMGPDFGFDYDVVEGHIRLDGSVDQARNPGLSAGLYSDDMWEAYVQGVGNHLGC